MDTTFTINACYPPGISSQMQNLSVCSGAMNHVTMHQMDFICTEDYAAIVKENERLKAEVTQLKERLAGLE